MSALVDPDVPGFFAPVHRALTDPILMGGAPRTVAIANGALAAAIALGLRLWITGALIWAVGHAAAVWAAKRDPQFVDVVRRHLRYAAAHHGLDVDFKRRGARLDRSGSRPLQPQVHRNLCHVQNDPSRRAANRVTKKIAAALAGKTSGKPIQLGKRNRANEDDELLRVLARQLTDGGPEAVRLREVLAKTVRREPIDS